MIKQQENEYFVCKKDKKTEENVKFLLKNIRNIERNLR
jgi:hypothetical protein